jgi:hypothetical protein
LQKNTKSYLKRIETLEEGRTLDVDSLSGIQNMAAILPALAEIKTDLLLKFCPKDRIKELENKIFTLEEQNRRGLSKKETELHD